MRSRLLRGQDTAVEFRTAMPVVLWPLAITEARYFSHAPDLGLTRIPSARAAKGGLRIKLQRVDLFNSQAPFDYVLQIWV